MAQGYEITYNDFGSGGADANFKWKYIKVQTYTSKPVFSEDDQTQWSTHHTLSGTALLDSSGEGLETAIQNARKKLSKPGRNLLISLDGEDAFVDVGNNSFANLAGAGDSLAGEGGSIPAGNSDTTSYPRCTFDINKFYGSENAMVSFTFEWMETMLDALEDGEDNWHVLSHSWRQSFSIAETGLQTWTVEGVLHVKPYPSDCSANTADVKYGRNPDSYRRLVMPALPTNFRVKSMQWATDKTGEKLIYTVTMQEHARGLPAPGKTGTGSFRFKRSLDSEGGMLGIKTFDAELEGDARANPMELLSALLDASTKRIRWVGTNKDIVISVEVRESEIFSKKRIGLRVTARGTDPKFVEGLSGAVPGPGSITNFGIFSNFVKNYGAIAPDAYGGALIGSFKKQMFIPYANYTTANFPKAQLLGLPGGETEVGPDSSGDGGAIDDNDCAYSIEEENYVFADNPETTGDTSHGNLTGPILNDTTIEPTDFKFLKIRGTERLGVKHHNVVLSTLGNTPTQIPWAVALPDIILESEYTLTRHDKTPPMLHFKLPQYSTVLDEQTSVEAGEVDGNGHRVFTRHIRRKVQLLMGWENPDIDQQSVEVEWTSPGAGEMSFTVRARYFYPGIESMSRPYDLRTDSHSNILAADIFSGMSGSTDHYPISFDVPVKIEHPG